ncbi:MAG: AGE family epimerase/isomerase [Lentisphaerae bacterium]|nr:AGE family epimerase/isomerase [Lentisphaerota bacterium]
MMDEPTHAPPAPADLGNFYKNCLLRDILPFWVKFAPDPTGGGYHTNLNRDGTVYDYTKSCMWSQGRVAWTMAHMHNELEQRPEWLATARLGVEFLQKHAFTSDNRIYYSMTRDGRPLEKPLDIFAELSAVLAFTEYARATQDLKLHQQARQLFDRCWRYTQDAGNRERNAGWDPKTCTIRRHGHAMIVLNVIQQLRLFQGETATDRERADACLDYMLKYHQKPERRLVLEVVEWEDGGEAPGWMGRWINPGHMIEGGIFLIHEGLHRNASDLKQAGINWIKWGFEWGWDKEYGGLFNDVDAAHLPIPDTAMVLADSKLWWQHAEALYGLLLACAETSDPWFREAYEKIHAYSFGHFADPLLGEWYAILDRTGRPINQAKGTSRKNCFHIGRNFLWAWQLTSQNNRLHKT